MQKRSERLHLAVRPSTKEVLERAARKRGVSLSELVRAGAKLFAFDELTASQDEEAEADE